MGAAHSSNEPPRWRGHFRWKASSIRLTQQSGFPRPQKLITSVRPRRSKRRLLERQRAYSVNPNLINLNNGGVSPAPVVVQQAVERYNQLANEGPSYYMWRILDQGREPLREKLAQLGGAQPGEIAINRNSTEALNTIIYGLELKKWR